MNGPIRVLLSGRRSTHLVRFFPIATNPRRRGAIADFFLAAQGADVGYVPDEVFDRIVARERDHWARAIALSGAKIAWR